MHLVLERHAKAQGRPASVETHRVLAAFHVPPTQAGAMPSPAASPRSGTALANVHDNHTRRLEHLHSSPLNFETTSGKTFAHRQTLEQFGVNQFNIRSTISKLPPHC